MAPDKKTNLIKFGFLCALVCWQIFTINDYVVQPFREGNGLSWKRSEHEYFASDFLHYYTAGVMSRSVDHLRIYDLPVHFPYVNALMAPRTISKDSHIQFSPPMIAIMSAVSLIPLVPAYILWTTASFIFGMSGLCLLLKRVGALSSYQIAVFLVVTSATLCSITALKMGQWTWWYIGLFSFFFVSSLQKKEILSGICLGLLTVKPQYSLPLVILTGLEKRFWALAIVGIVVAASCACAAGLIGWDNVLHYPQIVAAFAVRPDLQGDVDSHCSLRSFFAMILPLKAAVAATSISYFIALGAFALNCLLCRKSIKENIYWFCAMGILVGLIFAPLMFQYDALLVCLAAALTLRTLVPAQINKLKPLSLKIWHWIFLIYPIFTWIRSIYGNGTNYFYSLVNIVLLICAISYLQNRAKIKSVL